jgi:uncharacterized membrane protein
VAIRHTFNASLLKPLPKASYVVAVCELSIAAVAVLNVAVLKEPMTLAKGLSTVAIVVGVVLVKVA